MTTKLAGGKITGLLALTMEATVALDVGDLVHVNGDYTVTLADGTKPILGRCSVANKGATATPMSRTVGTPVVPGDVTIEARGISVEEFVSDGVFAAGVEVGTADGTTVVALGAGVQKIGISLLASTAAGESVDVLITTA